MACEQTEAADLVNGAENQGSSKKFTLMVGDKEYPRRVALLVMGGVGLFLAAVFGTVGMMMAEDLQYYDTSDLLKKALVLVPFMIGFTLWSRRSQRKEAKRRAQRREELAQFVQERGWNYTPYVSSGGDRYAGVGPLPTLGLGAHNSIWDHITGEYRRRTFGCFEYHKRGMGNDPGDNKLHFYTVFAITTPAPAPRMTVREREALDRLAARIFSDGQVVELGIPEFDKKFSIFAHDEAFTRSVMGGRLAQFLLSDPRAEDEILEFHGNELILWRKGAWSAGTLGTQDILPKLDYLCDVLDRIPAEAWRPA